jgi:hypothetical protein
MPQSVQRRFRSAFSSHVSGDEAGRSCLESEKSHFEERRLFEQEDFAPLKGRRPLHGSGLLTVQIRVSNRCKGSNRPAVEPDWS